MKNNRWKSLLIFVLGMLTFAIGYFIVTTFVLVERPTPVGIIDDWKSICFWPDEGGISAAISPRGCFSPTCTRPQYQAGTAIVDVQNYRIQLESRFVVVEASRFPLPCVENCAGGGTVQFKLGTLLPSEYEVWFRDAKVGKMQVYSGRETPRQCLYRSLDDM